MNSHTLSKTLSSIQNDQRLTQDTQNICIWMLLESAENGKKFVYYNITQTKLVGSTDGCSLKEEMRKRAMTRNFAGSCSVSARVRFLRF